MDNHRIDTSQFADYPTLAALRLTPDELEELSRQGFVCEERRGKRKYYKLRFRSDGKQIVRYLGDAERAATIEKELSILQNESTVLRNLDAKMKIASKMLREAKTLMEPVLNANGFVFHGFAIRQAPRRRSNVSNNSKPGSIEEDHTMEIQSNQTDTTASLGQTSELAVQDTGQLADRHDARLSRVLDYQTSSLQKEDALEANLGSINSGLMRVALWLDETIEQAMGSGPPNVERLARILPTIDTHLRVTRQVDRFAQIELRAAEARKPKPADDRPAAKLCLDAPSTAGISQSEDSEF